MPISLKLTDRAHYDLQKIETYSHRKWGRAVANRYLEDIQTALSLLQENPALLRNKLDISEHFQFYRVCEDLLVCLTLKDVLLVLTIKHGQMDLSRRLVELEPTLIQEADLLYQRLVAAEKKRRRSRQAKS
ncbi:type II toxin-antitoxin system RelE/ParE family toxin [Nitrospira sp. M1]